MPTDFDVFVSYSHRDADFVRKLVSCLRQTGLRVMADEERFVPGEDLRSAIADRLARSRDLLVICTEAWVSAVADGKHEWLKREVDLFDLMARQHRDATHRIVPLLLVPPALVPDGVLARDVLGVTWESTDPESEADLWRLFAGLRRLEPGPRSGWAESWRAAVRAGRSATAPVVGQSSLALYCDREPQRVRVIDALSSPIWSLVFVPGPVGQGHLAFMQSMACLSPHLFPSSDGRSPPRGPAIRQVRWCRRVPTNKSEAESDLARALGCAPDELAPSLRAVLLVRPLLLLHDPVVTYPAPVDGYSFERLLAYFGGVLPDLLGEARAEAGDAEHGVTLVQPIAWATSTARSAPLAKIARFFGAREAEWVTRCLARHDVLLGLDALVAKLKTTALDLRVEVLEALGPFSREDLQDWRRKYADRLEQALGGPERLEDFVESLRPEARSAGEILMELTQRLGAPVQGGSA